MSESYQREAAIFDAAMELTPMERAAHLDRACGGDAALRRRVEALLQACDSTCVILDSPADPVIAPAGGHAVIVEKSGDRIGRYKLLEQIGEGGCGVVYVAEQAEPVRRRVALKVIKLGMDTRSVIARFEAERQALAMMDHPNIAKVLDAGATETGRPYFVMELVRGMKITEYCDGKKLPTRERLDLFIQVCHAIQHAHQKGIIHRDIKPSNILVTVNDGLPVPRVIDFGIAKATGGQQLTDRTIYTAFEQFIGTPAYMSPEQAVLTSLDIDTRSDIYALGVLLYELLTGRTPFNAQELLAIGLDEMRRTIREQEPQRPSTRVSTLPGQELSTTAQRRGLEAPKLVSELRGDLDWIVMKALEKDRTRRYETANGLAQDVQRHLNNEPVVACPPGRLYRLKKMVRRNRFAFAAGTAVAASLVTGLALATVMFLRERAAREEAGRQAARANEQTAVARAVNTFLLDDLLQQADVVSQAAERFKPDPNLTVRQALLRAAGRIGKRFKDQPLQEAAVRMVIGSSLRGTGQAAQGVAQLRQAVELRRRILGPNSEETLDATVELARTLYSAGKVDEALPLYEYVLKVAIDTLAPDNVVRLNAMSDMARIHREAGNVGRALALYEETLRINESSRGPNHPDTLGGMNNLAMGYQEAGRLDDASALLEEALKRMSSELTLNHPFTQNAMCNLADVYRDLGRIPEALALLREAVDLRKGTMGAGHPHTLSAMLSLADAWTLAGNDPAAENVYREALALLRPPAEEVPHFGYVLHHLAGVLRKRKVLGEARSLAEEAVTVYERHREWPLREQGHAYKVLKAVLSDLGDAAGAEAVHRRHMEALQAAAAKDNLEAVNSLAWIFATSREAGHRDGPAAVKFGEKAAVMTGRKNPEILDTLAAAYAETREFAKAADTIREAMELCQDGERKSTFLARLRLYESGAPCRDP